LCLALALAGVAMAVLMVERDSLRRHLTHPHAIAGVALVSLLVLQTLALKCRCRPGRRLQVTGVGLAVLGSSNVVYGLILSLPLDSLPYLIVFGVWLVALSGGVLVIRCKRQGGKAGKIISEHASLKAELRMERRKIFTPSEKPSGMIKSTYYLDADSPGIASSSTKIATATAIEIAASATTSERNKQDLESAPLSKNDSKDSSENLHGAEANGVHLRVLSADYDSLAQTANGRVVDDESLAQTANGPVVHSSLDQWGEGIPSRVAIAMDSPSLSKRVLSISLRKFPEVFVEEPSQQRSPRAPIVEVGALIDAPDVGSSLDAPKLSVLESLDARGKQCTQNSRIATLCICVL
jgi:hypothetical protein